MANTQKTVECPIIIVDERERGSIRGELDRLDCQIQIETLDVGDYILSNEVAVERKRGDDFAQSLFDNRLFEQLNRLKATFKHPLIVLEDFEKMFERGEYFMPPLYGAMCYCAYKIGIPIIPTRDYKDTAIVLRSIARREQIRDKAPILARTCPKGMDHKERQIFLLEGLYQTGQAKGEQLLEHFATPFAVFEAILDTTIERTSSGRPKGLTGKFGDIKGFGPKFIQTNQELLGGSEPRGED